jgi:mycofactocin precursor
MSEQSVPVVTTAAPTLVTAQEAKVEVSAVAEPATESELVLEDLIVEDISIDGMCGVY